MSAAPFIGNEYQHVGNSNKGRYVSKMFVQEASFVATLEDDNSPVFTLGSWTLTKKQVPIFVGSAAGALFLVLVIGLLVMWHWIRRRRRRSRTNDFYNDEEMKEPSYRPLDIKPAPSGQLDHPSRVNTVVIYTDRDADHGTLLTHGPDLLDKLYTSNNQKGSIVWPIPDNSLYEHKVIPMSQSVNFFSRQTDESPCNFTTFRPPPSVSSHDDDISECYDSYQPIIHGVQETNLDGKTRSLPLRKFNRTMSSTIPEDQLYAKVDMDSKRRSRTMKDNTAPHPKSPTRVTTERPSGNPYGHSYTYHALDDGRPGNTPGNKMVLFDQRSNL